MSITKPSATINKTASSIYVDWRSSLPTIGVTV